MKNSKYNRTYHLSFSEGAYNDDKIAESISPLLGREIVITEKLDGSNTGMVNEGVYGRSHATFTENSWDREVRQLHSVKVKGYLSDDVYIFGESLYAIHSIEYTNLKSYFYIFGVREKSTWLSWVEVEEYSYLLDIPTVPILFKGVVNTEAELQKIVKSFVCGESSLGGEIEGVVIRLADSFDDSEFSNNVQKWVRPNHVTTDEHWQRNWKKAKLKL